MTFNFMESLRMFCLVTAMVLLLTSGAFAWWDAGFTARQNITVSSSVGTIDSGYETYIPVTYDADMQADFDDLRFVDATDGHEIPHWIENKVNSTSADVWVRMEDTILNAGTLIYMYYDNAGASSNSSANNTWDFTYDANVLPENDGWTHTIGTEDTWEINPAGWFHYANVGAIKRGQAVIDPTNSWNGSRVVSKFYWTNCGATGIYTDLILKDGVDWHQLACWSATQMQSYENAGWVAYTEAATGFDYSEPNVWFSKTNPGAGKCEFRINETSIKNFTCTASAAETFTFGQSGSSGAAFNQWLDYWYGSYKSVATEPLSVFGAEEGGGGAAPWYYTVESSTFSDPVYETTNTSFNFTVKTNKTAIVLMNANMSWNGTVYQATSSGNNTIGNNNTYWFAYEDFGVPLVTANYTNISQLWNYNFTWDNATVSTHTDATNTQAIFYYFYWGTYDPDLITYEGHSFDMDTAFSEGRSGIVYNVTSIFNNTNYILVGAAGVYTGSATAPDINGNNKTFISNSTFYLDFTGTDGLNHLYDRISANASIVVYAPALINCTVGGMPTLNFTFKGEKNITDVPSDMDAAFTWWTLANHTGIEYTANFSVINTIDLSLCIYPNTTLYVDSFQVYEDHAGDYRTRNYFLNNATLTNISEVVIDLYNIPITESDLLTLTIVDDLVAQEGDYVSMERYYPGEDLYRTVEIGMTDEDGQTFLYPVPNDVYYRFIVIRNYTTVYSGDPREIGISSFTIDTGGELTLEYFDYQGISVSCDRTADIIGCSLVNPTGLSVGAALLVRQIGIYSDTEICYTTSSQVSTTTLLCNVSGYSGLIQADLMFIAPESLISIWTENFNGTATNVFGDLGLFITIFIVIGSALLLAYSPALSLVGAVLGLVISAILGIVALSLTNIILIVVAAAFLIVRVKS